jgi:multiple sugar transport system permease protein
VAFVAIVPFLWMLSTSLKTTAESSAYPPTVFPSVPQWQNYSQVFDTVPFLTFFRNTAFYAFVVAAGQLLFCSTAAFAFARLKFAGRDILFLLYLATLMIPLSVTIVPALTMMRWFGWVNTIWVMTAPGVFGSPFGTFLLRQFMLAIPSDLDEAAKIDGAGLVRLYWQIILPLSRPALTVLAVLTLMTVWNDFLWPLVMLNSNDVLTLTVGLSVFATGAMSQFVSVPQALAAATLTVTPLILLFVVAQRYFVQGIALTGLGGR